MRRTINTIVIDDNHNASFQRVTAHRNAVSGLTMEGVPEYKASEILLKALTGINACGFKTPDFGIKITISNHGENPDILTAPIAVAILVLSRQIKPVTELENIIIAGDLKLNGELKECYTFHAGSPVSWPESKTQFMTDHTRMHIMPKDTDLNLKMTEKGPFTVEALDLKTIQDILECNIRD